jgi:hypothetical protein
MTNIDFTVPGTVPRLAQPTNNTCWATAATILFSWKENRTLKIADLVNRAGADFKNKFLMDMGLSGVEKPFFLGALGLRTEPPQNFTAQGWLSLLRNNGALWVTGNETPNQGFAIHARIFKGIFGDGSADATFLSIVDPADGSESSESIRVFTEKFESVVKIDLGVGADLRPQVVHF